MKQKLAYSNILQDFAKPLLLAGDTDDEFITKMKVAELIWNYCIAKEFALPIFEAVHQAIEIQNKNLPEMKQLFDMFVSIKKFNFDKYKNFIVTVELRINNEGNKTLYVESIPPENFNKM